MADNSRVEGSQVYCHNCRSSWNRNEGGLTCPTCESEFVEILSPSTEDGPRWDSESPQPHDHGLHNHYPFEETGMPGNRSPQTFQWSSPHGHGGSSFSFTIHRGGFPGGMDRGVESDFQDLFGMLMGGRRARSPGSPRHPGMGGLFGPPPGFPGFGAPPGFGPPGSPGSPNRRGGGLGQHGAEPTPRDLMSMFLDQGSGPGPQQGRAGTPPMHPFAQILGMLFPGNMHGPNGDYVMNREDLDRIITQMMEQNPQGNAPPPATDAAISALPKKMVSKDMLDDTGKAECTICMENADLGSEVTLLPCTHWFHPDCIKPWLLQNQTCPHCRKGVQQWFDETNNPQTPHNRAQSEPSRSRRSSRSYRRDRLSPAARSDNVEGTRSNPVLIASSPPRMPGGFGDENPPPGGASAFPPRRSSPYAFTPEHRPSPGSRRESGRHSSNRSNRGGGGGDGGGGGGVSGWFRDHNPFSSGRG